MAPCITPRGHDGPPSKPGPLVRAPTALAALGPPAPHARVVKGGGGGARGASGPSALLYGSQIAGVNGVVKKGQVQLNPDHPDYFKRRAENMAKAKERMMKRKADEEKDRAIAMQVMKQLNESRLDHVSNSWNGRDCNQLLLRSVRSLFLFSHTFTCIVVACCFFFYLLVFFLVASLA